MALFATSPQPLQMTSLATDAARQVVEHVGVQAVGAAWVFHVAPSAVVHPGESRNLTGFLGNVGVSAPHLADEKLDSRKR